MSEQVVYTLDEVNVGDVVAYPGEISRWGQKRPGKRSERDWLTVSRIDEHGIHGYRLHPEDWEREVEFVVVLRQLRVKGVEVRAAPPVIPAGKDTT